MGKLHTHKHTLVASLCDKRPIPEHGAYGMTFVLQTMLIESLMGIASLQLCARRLSTQQDRKNTTSLQLCASHHAAATLAGVASLQLCACRFSNEQY